MACGGPPIAVRQRGVRQSPLAPPRRSISLFGGQGKRDRATRALAEAGGAALANAAAVGWAKARSACPPMRREQDGGHASLCPPDAGPGTTAALLDKAQNSMPRPAVYALDNRTRIFLMSRRSEPKG